jgi:hypothetical protein
MSETKNNTRNRGAAMLGWVLVGLGALFLVFQVIGVRMIDFLWPFFIIIPGLLFFVGMVMGGKEASPLAIPGSVITGTGLLLFYQSITNHWESWAYAWTLYLGFVGAGIVIHGAWSNRNDTAQTGFRLIGISVILFLVFGTFFELLLNISGSNLMGNILWPGMFILVGLYLLLRRGKPALTPGENGRQVEFEPIDMARNKRQPSGKSKKTEEETIAE